MATTLDEIGRYLEEANLRFRRREENSGFFELGFRSESYRSPRGDDRLLVIIQANDEGETLSLFTPGLYVYKDGPNAFAVLGACLHAAYRTKFVQYIWDPVDGEIRAEVEIPLVDARLTANQFHRCLQALLHVVEACDPMIRGAMETGKIVPPEQKEESAAPPAMEDLIRLLANADPEKLRQLLEQAGARRPGVPTAL